MVEEHVLDEGRIFVCRKALGSWKKRFYENLTFMKMKLYNKANTGFETIKICIFKSGAKT